MLRITFFRNKCIGCNACVEAAPDRWFHSDLVAENLLLTDGRLSGVLDFGALSIGDP